MKLKYERSICDKEYCKMMILVFLFGLRKGEVYKVVGFWFVYKSFLI